MSRRSHHQKRSPPPVTEVAAPRRSASPRAPPTKRGRRGAAVADEEEQHAAREAALAAKEAELDARETAVAIGEEQLALAESKLRELKVELEERAAQLERDSERLTPPSVVRQQARRAKIEERMRLAVTLNRLPREADGDLETVKEALSRMGKSYQDLNEGNGFLAAGALYGGIEGFLALFAANERLTNVTLVARLLDVIKGLKWRVTSESDESAEERAKTMLHAFRRRVRDVKTMARVQRWSKGRNLQGLTEDDIAELLYSELPDAESEEEGVVPSAAAAAVAFKPPAALPELPDKLALRDEKLRHKILADQYDEACDKELFYLQHGKYNVLIGRALRSVCEAYRVRAGSMGRLDGSRFFFGLFPEARSGKRKRADLGTVEEAAILIAGLGDSDQMEEFARLVDTPEQMEDVCKLARDAVELQTATVKDANAVAALKKLLVELEQGKRPAVVLNFIKKYASDEVPMRKDPRAALALLDKHIGEPILDALSELSRVDLGEGCDHSKLKQALHKFHEAVELVFESDDTQLRPSERDAFVIASMLLWKRHKEVNKVDGAAKLMAGTFSTLGAILGKPGREFPVWDPETGSDEHLFTWPSIDE